MIEITPEMRPTTNEALAPDIAIDANLDGRISAVNVLQQLISI
jgi:hypothetical protein